MSNHINNLVQQYILWPELKNDFQKNIRFGKTKFEDLQYQLDDVIEQRQESIDLKISTFYLANEKLNRSRLEVQDVLGEKELDDYKFYQNTLNDLSKELLTYITVCCLVESRHVQTFADIRSDWVNFLEDKEFDTEDSHVSYGLGNEELVEAIKEKKHGSTFIRQHFSGYKQNYTNKKDYDQFYEFLTTVPNRIRDLLSEADYDSDDRDAGYQHVARTLLTDELSNHNLEQVLTYLKQIFENNHFEEGYGGDAWAVIAKHALNFAQGKINAEMFVDQAFSLEHNNGNMFNKDFLFEKSGKNEFTFPTDEGDKTEEIPLSSFLLNAQHLGMLPGLLNLETISDKMLGCNPEEVFEALQKAEQFTDWDLYQFSYVLEMVQKSYSDLVEALEYTRKSVKELRPELLEGSTYIDFRELLHAVGQSNGDLYELSRATNDQREVFELWSYLHNQHFSPSAIPATEKPFKFDLLSVENLPDGAFDKSVIGGKAWSLANMQNLGLPVPAAKVFTTDCCSSYTQHNDSYHQALDKELPKFKDFLTDSSGSPILCSIRSGAPVSMPGMMDTVLNVGIDDSNYQYFCDKMGKSVTDNCVNKFMELFCSSRLGLSVDFEGSLTGNLLKFRDILSVNDIPVDYTTTFPLSQSDQIRESLTAVFSSWNSPRAKAFRQEKGISEDIGTAAIVQHMVFGNLNDNSCTGVVFSRDCLTGENKLVGEFLPKAQGEDVVSGSVTPFNIDKFKDFNPTAYAQLETYAKKLEKTTGQIQDIEFTVESGKLYILQHRQAVCSPIAAIELLRDKTLDTTALLKQINPKLLQNSMAVVTEDKPVAEGLSANSGVMCGMVVRTAREMEIFKNQFQEHSKNNKNFGWIFYSELTSPHHMPIMNKTQAFITEQGGFTSHAAIIARSLNKPCVVGLGGKNTGRFQSGQILTVDGTNGKIWEEMQPLVANNELARTAAKFLMKKNNVSVRDIDKVAFKERVEAINYNHSSWLLNLPEAQIINTKPIKKDKFLNLGQKVAMILSANDRNVNKLKMA